MENNITFENWKYALHDARYSFVEEFAKHHPKKVLILACGVGLEAFILHKFVDLPCEILGIDIDKSSIEYAKNKLEQLQYPDIYFLDKDIENFFETNKEKFDSVMIMFAIHFFDRRKILEKVSKLLEPNGIFGVCEWLPDNSLASIKHINEIIQKYASEGKILEQAKMVFRNKNKYLYGSVDTDEDNGLKLISKKSKSYSINYVNLKSYWSFQKNNELFKRLRQDMVVEDYLRMLEEIEIYVQQADDSDVEFIAKVGNSFYKK